MTPLLKAFYFIIIYQWRHSRGVCHSDHQLHKSTLKTHRCLILEPSLFCAIKSQTLFGATESPVKYNFLEWSFSQTVFLSHPISKENYFIICSLCLSSDIQPLFLEPPRFVPKTNHKTKKINRDPSATRSPPHDHVKTAYPFCHKECIYSDQSGHWNYLT